MPERFGNYDLIRKLAIGGMAEVYLATVVGPEGFHKHVVIKRILPVYSEDPDFVSMFINEARLAAKLQHSNIVQVFDFNRVGDAYYIAMEWVDGVDLERATQLAERANMPMPRVVAIHVACEALKGLRYAHTRTDQGTPLNLVHRDISPPNLMLSSSGEVKIADFGIARVAIQAAATREGFVKGKLAYMSPEQLRGQRADHRSDIFSLGLVLWELLAHKPAYGAAVTTGELINMVRDGQIQPLAAVEPSIPEELAVVVHRMLAKEPNERYGSAAEAFDALRRFSGPTDGLAAANYVSDLLSHDSVPIEEPPRRTQTFDSRPKPLGSWESAGASSPVTPPPFAFSAPAALLPSRSSTATSLRRRRFTRFALAAPFALFSLILSAWGMTALRGRETIPAAVPLVPLRLVQSTAPEIIYVDGVPLAPHKETIVYGANGETLRVRLAGPPPLHREVIFGRTSEFVLLAEDRPSATTSAARQTPPDAGVRSEVSEPRTPPVPSPKAPESPKQPRLPSDDRPRLVSRRFVGHRGESPAAADIFVRPWAYVYVDNRSAGITPLKHYPLTPGKHHLRLENPELGRKENRVVNVRPGEVAQVRADWLP